jgi:hypothetical protein
MGDVDWLVINQMMRGVLHMTQALFWISFAITQWLARDTRLSSRYWRLKIMWALLYAIWFAALYTSQYPNYIITRALLVWPLAILELGFCIAGWSWLLLTLADTFKFEFRRTRHCRT